MNIETERLMLHAIDVEVLKNIDGRYEMSSRFIGHIHKLLMDPGLIGWDAWIIERKADQMLIGDAGFKGRPNFQHEVEVGYGILPDYQNNGYGYEAVKALLNFALIHHPEVKVRATTLKENEASNQLLKKLMFECKESDESYYYWYYKGQ